MKRVTKADLWKRNTELHQKLIELVMRPNSMESELIKTEVKYGVATEVAIMYGEPCLNTKGLIDQIINKNESHIIFEYKGKIYEVHKNWDFNRIERVLTRLGATYWEIGI